ncbi:DNA-packaging protein [Trinickia mobilis]|uniref:DNA-packaging protein n=1 Tax=Trinickia mobilis TaxID=2816356 RepID=UPI001A8EBFDB|nr:terminase family protein [Trinickia mobilis]
MAELERRRRDWYRIARPNQLAPDGDWYVWLILAGRGFGKTRTGAEWIRQQVKRYQFCNLIGATSDDARDIMIEGESGILAVCPQGERPLYKKSERKLLWPNGAVSLIFTADEPERLRGKQHMKLWADELGSWRYPEAWDQAMFGLRLGDNPQAVVTTTPRPTKLIRELVKADGTVVTRGSTYDNQQNLAPSFFKQIITKYEGTRLGRQELNAELLEDNPNALWTLSQIDAARVKVAPPLLRVVVAIDPAVTSNEDSDESGIVIAGLGTDQHYYVLDDVSLIAKPSEWARAGVKAYHDRKADRIVAEVNNGGDLVETVIRTVDTNVAYRKVTATRGKLIRAEPVSALYEQGRVHHVGTFSKLEDQMCDFNPITSTKSPDRMDALVWAITDLSDTTGLGLFSWMSNEAAAAEAAKKAATQPQ